jgi:flagellar basal body-associated protein FliL
MMTRNSLKISIKAFIAVFFAAIICIFGCMTAFAWDHDETWQQVRFENAPEGTFFVDLLVKAQKDDEYTVEFNEENGKLLGLGKDCELAKYDKDGYTSLLLRHGCAVLDYLQNDEGQYASGTAHYTYNTENYKVFNKLNKVKLAYCDSKGNILMITNTAEIGYAFFKTPVMYFFKADGESLVFKFAGATYSKLRSIISVVIIAVLIAAVVLLFSFFNRKIVKRSAEKRIQSGETDNERKE